MAESHHQILLSTMQADHAIGNIFSCKKNGLLDIQTILIFILAFIFILLIIMIFCNIKKQKNKLKPIVTSLNNMLWNYKKDHNSVLFISHCNELLKEIITYHRNIHVASLHGVMWLKTLDHIGNTNQFTRGKGQILGHYYAQRRVSFNADVVICLIKKLSSRVVNHG